MLMMHQFEMAFEFEIRNILTSEFAENKTNTI